MANWAGTLLDGTTRLSIDGKPVYHFSTVACFADRTVVPEQCCVPIRKEVPAVIAALLGCAVTTGVGAVLNTARIQPGSSVVVAGVGGVGASIILAARLSGAVPIVAVDTTEEKAAAALDLGASEAFVAGEGVPPRIRALTGGRGADYVFDATGLPSVQEQCLDCIRPGGTIVLVGISPVGSSTNFPGAILTRREITVMGSYYGTSNPARDFPLYADLYLERKLDLDRLVTRTFSLSQINEAYAEMVGGKTVRGVIVF
jgi:Zn-dependent alcohol dehydrogenase